MRVCVCVNEFLILKLYVHFVCNLQTTLNIWNEYLIAKINVHLCASCNISIEKTIIYIYIYYIYIILFLALIYVAGWWIDMYLHACIGWGNHSATMHLNQ